MGLLKKRVYGKEEGLAERLEKHAAAMETDKTLPWIGLGLYDDLKTAAKLLRGETVAPKLEYDL